MQKASIEDNPHITEDVDVKLEDMYEVVLHNDDVNDAVHVVITLISVFAHKEELAVKIMMEAHNNGQAIAEVEAESNARLHRDQLQSYGLIATVNRV